jgi:LPXTG-site transpeptidase (sortase) family protein
MCDYQVPYTECIGTWSVGLSDICVIRHTFSVIHVVYSHNAASIWHVSAGVENGERMDDTLMVGHQRSTGTVFVRTTAHALGNVLLGLALGLAAYYGITDLAAKWDQRALREELGALAFTEPPVPEEADDGSALDFSGYEDQDLPYWDAQREGEVFARLVIEPIELDTLVVKGHSRSALKRGAGWIDYTDLPGPTGNCGIAGHRTTYGAPFRRIDELETGDTIDLYSPFRRYRYRVTETFRVTPDRVDVMATTDAAMLTLSACDPPYSARYRLIVRGELIEVTRLDAPR